MKILFFSLLFTSAFWSPTAYDLLEGFAQLSRPCFDVIHGEQCNTTLPMVFTPEYKGANINSPNTQVYLFTNKNPQKGEPLHRCGGKLPQNSDFDPNGDTVVIYHGWLDGICRTAWMREIKAQLFIRGNYNVILTDWTYGNTFDLIVASVNAKVAGEQVGFVLENIMNQMNVNGDKFHLVGHSFGSIAASSTAKYLKNKKKKVRRLTPLDPPVSPFRDDPPETQIYYKDAKFVDVIHSCAGDCYPFKLGDNHILGHADFFPNGGSTQPSCVPYIFTSFLKMDYFYALGSLYPQFCFHLHSIQYFKVSINHPNGLYIGAPCDNYEDFKSGACKRCCNNTCSDCAVAGMDAEYYFPHTLEPRRKRTYFFDTSIYCPYTEDYDFSIYKDC